MSLFSLLARMKSAKARKIAKANADSAYKQAHARYVTARRSDDCQAQHHAALSLKAAQTRRLMIEAGRL